MKSLTVSCYAIALALLGLSILTVTQRAQLNVNSLNQSSASSFGAIAHQND